MARELRCSVSDKELVVLALVAEEPIHAYGLEEKIRARQMTDWTVISFSSIYRVLRGLETKALLVSKLVHEGQGATRKVHEVTEEGRRVLSAGVLCRLRSPEDVVSPFFLAVYAMTAAPRDEVCSALEDRIVNLDSLDDLMEKQESEAQGTLDAIAARLPPAERERVNDSAGLRIDSIFELARRYRTVEREFLKETLARVQSTPLDRFEIV